MIGVPCLVAAAVAAVFGHYVLAVALLVIGVAELVLWSEDVGRSGRGGPLRRAPLQPIRHDPSDQSPGAPE